MSTVSIKRNHLMTVAECHARARDLGKTGHLQYVDTRLRPLCGPYFRTLGIGVVSNNSTPPRKTQSS